jgi:hypothetical protein
MLAPAGVRRERAGILARRPEERRFRSPRHADDRWWPACSVLLLRNPPMSLSLKHARELCTQAELALVQASRPTSLRSLTERALRLKVRRARGLRDKFRDLAVRQARKAREEQRGTRRAARPARAPLRTKQKAALFEEVLRRFEARASELASPSRPRAPRAPVSARPRGARTARDGRRRARSEDAAGARKAVKLRTSHVPRRNAHASSRNRRGQARRDAR